MWLRLKVKQCKCISKCLYNSNVGKMPPVLCVKYSIYLKYLSKYKVLWNNELANPGI